MFFRNNRLSEKLHRDNRGSSMMIALVAIAFIGILAAIITTTTMTNYRLRAMNAKSKKTFYNAESAVDEISSGLGDSCYTELKEAYITTVTTLVDVDNDKANRNLRSFYLSNVKKLCADWTDESTVIAYLNSFLSDPENASVISVDTPSEDELKVLPIVLSDVVVQYREKATDDFSTVAVDLRITYPNVVFDFIDDSNHLKSYLNYSMIGMDGIDIATTSSGKISVTGGIFAGKGYEGNASVEHTYGGLVIENGSRFTVNSGTADVKSTVVTDGDIKVYGTMNVTGSNEGSTTIWAEGITVGYASDTQSAGTLNFSTGSGSKTTTYVADDLTIVGKDSQVTLGTNYYGFGIANIRALNSSAIIINGLNSSLDASKVNEMVLGGKAFISDTKYAMADTVGIKGLQTLYLVPATYMTDVNPLPNKTYATMVADSKEPVDSEALKEFFAYDLLDVEEGNSEKIGYVAKGTDNSYYFYLDFKSEAAASEYIYRIIHMKSSDGTVDYSTDEECVRLNAILNDSFDRFVDGSNLKVNTSATISTGTLYNMTDGISNITGGGWDSTDATEFHNANANRFLTETLFLYDTEDTDSRFDLDTSDNYGATRTDRELVPGDSVEITNADDTTDEHVIETGTNIYDYVVDADRLAELTSMMVKGIDATGVAGTDYYAIALNADCIKGGETDPDSGRKVLKLSELKNEKEVAINFSKGVILADNVDIYVDIPFTGLIVTNGRIKVTTKGSLTADPDITNLTISETGIANYFYAYQDIESEINPEDISTTDLMNVLNWRKNYVDDAGQEETTTE